MKPNSWKRILAFTMMAVLAGGMVWALPEIEEVQNGTVDIQTANNTMTINASNNAIVNYRSFSILQNESVVINLPSTDSQILNRVTGPDMSHIAGSLTSNGIIVLVNPNGIYVAPTGRINAASAILATRNITNEHFISGQYIFTKINQATLDKLLVNEGAITVANGGFAVLIAGAIENKGLITAKYGTIALAAGNAVRLELAGNRLIGIAVTEEAKDLVVDHQGNRVYDQIKNTGTLDAEGGRVILQAKSVEKLFQRLINTEGIIKATRLETTDGKVEFVANGPINLQGAIRATDIQVGDVPQNIVPNTIIIQKETVIEAEKTITMVATELIEINSTICAPTVNLVSQGLIDTTSPTAIIQGTNVQLQAHRFGRTNTPVNINADMISIKRLNGDIDIRQSLGIGSSIWIRGPPEGDSFGEIFYNANASQLALEGISLFTSGDPAQHTPVLAQKLILIAENSIGSADRPFYFNAPILAGATAQNGSIHLDTNGADILVRGDVTAAGDIQIFSGLGMIDMRSGGRIASLGGSVNLEPTKGNINLYGTVSAPQGVVRLWTCGTMDLREVVVISKDGGYIFNPEDAILASWVGGTGNWNVAGNWSGGVIPNSNQFSVTIDRAGVTVTLNATYTIGDITVGGVNDSTLTLSSRLTLQANTSAGTNGSLTIAGTGTVDARSTLSVGGPTVIDGTMNIATTTGTKTFIGLVTVNPTGAWNNTANESIVLRGGLTVNGAFNSGTAVYTFNTNSQSFAGTATIQRLTVTGVTLTNDGSLTVSNTLAGTGTLTQGIGSTLTLGNTISITNLNASASGNTVDYNRAGTQTIKSAAYYHLLLSNSGTKTAGGALTVNGDLTLSGSAVFAAGTSQTHTFLGSWIIDTTAATPFTYATSSTINFNTPGTPVATSLGGTTTATIAFDTLNVNNTSGFDVNDNISANGALTVANGATLTPAADVIVSGSGTLTGSGTVQVTRIAATPDFNSQYTIANKTLTNLGVDYAGAGNQTINALTYDNLSTSGSGTKTVGGITTINGLLTVNAGTAWDNAGNYAMTLRGGITNSGTFTAGTGVYTFTTNAQALSGDISIPNVTVTGITLTNNGTLTVSTALSGSGTLTQGTNAVLNIGGSAGITALTATANGNTVNYTGAAQTVKATTYTNLTLSGSGTKTTTGVTVNGVLSLEGTATVSAAPTYGTNATLRYNTATNRSTGTEWPSGGFIRSGGVIISNTGVITLNAARTGNSYLTIDAGSTFALGGYNFGFSASRAVVNNGTFQLYGSETLTNVANLDIDSGLVKYVGTGGPYTIKDFGAGTDYYDLQFQATTGNPTTGLRFTIGSTLVVANDMTISRAMVTQGTYAVTIGGSLYLDSGGYYTKSTNGQPITFTGSTPATIGDYNTYSNLGVIVVNKTSSTLALVTSLIVDRMTVNSDSTLDMGTGRHFLRVANTGAITDVLVVDGGFIGGLSTVQFTATNSGGNITLPNLAYDALQVSGAETYVLTGHQTGAKALTGDVTIDSGATLDLTASNYDLSCSDVTINSGGTLNGRGSTISVADNWYGFGTFTMGTSTVDFTHTAGLQSLYAGGVGTGHQFYDLAHTGAGILQFNESGVYISHNLINSAGAIETNGNNLTVAGSFSNAGGTLRVVGFETIGLTNDASAGTVEYTGNGSYTGLAAGSEYYNLSFTGAGTFTLDAPVIVHGLLGLLATPNFTYCRELTIQHQYVMEDMTYVPLAFVFSGFTNQSDIMSGANYTIKFTNADSVALSYEVEDYNPATGQLIVWIKVDSVSTTQDTKLYMYYGSNQTEALDNPKDVWRDSSFDAVWHFQDLQDSSWNENDGTNHGTTSVAGMIGNGRQFDNANFKVAPYNYPDSQYITTDLNLDRWLGGTSFVSMWVKPAATWTGADTDWQAPGIIGVEDNATVNDIYYGMADSTGRIYTAVGDTTGAKTTVAMNDGAWRYVVMTRDATTGVTNMYVNGALVSTVTSDTGFKSTAFYSIGRKEDTIIPPVLYPQYYYGALDELRISTVFKSANWIMTQYNNQNNPVAFTAVGAQTTGFKPTLNAGSQNITLYGDWVNNANFNAGTGTVTFAGNSTIGGTAAPVFHSIAIAPTGTLTAPPGTLTVTGDWANGGTFVAGTGTVAFTGGSAIIDAGGDGPGKEFYNVVIDTTGAKTIASDIAIADDLAVNNGILNGDYSVTVGGGDVTGAGQIDMTGGTFTIYGSGTFGGSGSDWTFYDLTFGDGITEGTTMKEGDNTVTVTSVLTVKQDQRLQAGSSNWNLEWASYLKNIVQITAGYDHTVALSSDGYVFAWGCNFMGQLGNDTLTDNLMPERVLRGEQAAGIGDKATYLHDITEIASGGYHTMALSSDGYLYAWGYNEYGQLGNNRQNTVLNNNDPQERVNLTPVRVLGVGGSGYLQNISHIAGGGFSSAAVGTTGLVYTWGNNELGQLGNNSTVDSLVPVQVLGGEQGGGYLTGISRVAVGGVHMAALTTAGAVYTWGYNGEGELGNGTYDDSLTPVQVLGGEQGGSYLTGIFRVSAGDAHVIVLTATGSVYAWGDDSYGQLGNGAIGASSLPVRVLAGEQGGSYLAGITEIAAGAAHSMAIVSGGTVVSWGDNRFGQLANDTYVQSESPVKILAGAQQGGEYLRNIFYITAGGAQTVAVSETNPVFAAGANFNGQLGNGTTVGTVAQIRVMDGSLAGPEIDYIPLVVESGGVLESEDSIFKYSNPNGLDRVTNIAPITFTKLLLDDATYRLTGDTTVMGDFSIDGGTLIAGAYDMNVGGDWTNTGGTFDAGTGAVTLDGLAGQSVTSDGSAFSTLVILNASTAGVAFEDRLVADTLETGVGVKKLAFAETSAAEAHTVTTEFDVDGASGNYLELTSLSGGTWYLAAPTSTHTYLRVSDSTATTGAQTATSSQDAGGNTNWNITP